MYAIRRTPVKKNRKENRDMYLGYVSRFFKIPVL